MKRIILRYIAIVFIIKLIFTVTQLQGETENEFELRQIQLLKQKKLLIVELDAVQKKINHLKHNPSQVCECTATADVCRNWKDWLERDWNRWIKDNKLSSAIIVPIRATLLKDCIDEQEMTKNKCDIISQSPNEEVCLEIYTNQTCHFALEGVYEQVTRGRKSAPTKVELSLEKLSGSVYHCWKVQEIDRKFLEKRNEELRKAIAHVDVELGNLRRPGSL